LIAAAIIRRCRYCFFATLIAAIIAIFATALPAADAPFRAMPPPPPRHALFFAGAFQCRRIVYAFFAAAAAIFAFFRFAMPP